ncbi:MAG: response regulator [bacterium]|nr:response regulator [bacterium]
MSKPVIAIVEDEEELRENLCDFLEFKGYEVLCFDSGDAAVAGCGDWKADLALLDYLMPGLNGIEVMKRLKEVHPDMPIVFLTASSQGMVKESARLKGAEAVILKPYSPNELIETIERILSRTA